MARINPHINFNGNAEEAFTFYQSVFGGPLEKIIRFKDIPGAAFPLPAEEEDKLMHIALPIGGGSLLTGNDVPSFMGKVNENENRSKIAINAETREEAGKLYHALSEGGEIEVPLDQNTQGPSFAMFRDKYGIEWMLNYEPAQ